MTTSRKDNILIVDDVPANLEILANILSPTYAVMAAKNGKKALEIAQNFPGPDLILLDVIMPELSGIETCALLKSDPRTRSIPVIFVSSQNEVVDEARGFEAGAVDYISKPVNPLLVRARVKTHLALSFANKELVMQNKILQENVSLLEQIEQIARHDLKSPLTIFLNASSFMEQEKNLTPQQKDFLKLLDASALKMLNMINRSLDLSKMERGQYTPTSVLLDMGKLVRQVWKELESLAESNAVRCEILVDGRSISDSGSVPIHGDHILLSTIVSNLVKNAIEASPEGETVVVSLTNQDPFLIEVKNKGVIPPEIASRFFERYATAGKRAGTGLGCYSARLMAKTLGGDIRFVTNPETGTVITVSIPLPVQNPNEETEGGK